MILVAIALVVALAGVLNGATAMGFAVLTSAGLALVADPRDVVLLLAVTNPIISALQLARHKGDAAARFGHLRLIAVGALVGVPIGAYLLQALDGRVVGALLGLITLLFVVVNVSASPPRIPERLVPVASPVAGLVAGVANGTVGVSGPILGAFLLSAGLRPAAFAFTISVLFLIMGLLRLASLTVLEQLNLQILALGAVLLVPAVLGQRIGFRLAGRLSTDAFRRAVLVALTLAAINVLVRSVLG